MDYNDKMTVFLLHLQGEIDLSICKMLIGLDARGYRAMLKSSELFYLKTHSKRQSYKTVNYYLKAERI
jgi:hypothetical protein